MHPQPRPAPKRAGAVPQKREPGTVWKLVDARCKQLADSVTAARVPFLLSLIWAFVWAWSLYLADVGYIKYYQKHIDRMAKEARAGADPAWFHVLCRVYQLQAHKRDPGAQLELDAKQLEQCESHFRTEGAPIRKWAEDLHRARSPESEGGSAATPAAKHRSSWYRHTFCEELA